MLTSSEIVGGLSSKTDDVMRDCEKWKGVCAEEQNSLHACMNCRVTSIEVETLAMESRSRSFSNGSQEAQWMINNSSLEVLEERLVHSER